MSNYLEAQMVEGEEVERRGVEKLTKKKTNNKWVDSVDQEVQLLQINHCDGVLINYWYAFTRINKLSLYSCLYVLIRPFKMNETYILMFIFSFFKQLAEEREKYMKSLEMELRKLQAANTDATNNFDERLNQLFVKKIKTEAVILQVRFFQSKKNYFHGKK